MIANRAIIIISPMFLSKDSKIEYIFIHGYTGGPTDFNGFPEFLSNRYGVDVKVPLLLGHGTDVSDLDGVEFDDYIKQLKEIIEIDLEKYEKVFLVGVSLGAILALDLASEYPVSGVLNINLPTRLRFPLNFPGLYSLRHFKKYWPKVFLEEELAMKNGTTYYPHMNIRGLKLIKDGKKLLRKKLGNIRAPVYSVHSVYDRIGSYKALFDLDKKIKSPHRKMLFTEKIHNVFFMKDSHGFYANLAEYFENEQDISTRRKVAAIVPAYNEEENIAGVLKVLKNVSKLDEIIVVDDASTDNTGEVVLAFDEVKYFRNEVNSGKAFSMQRGVNGTDADIIFFCDADLKKLTPEIVNSIIEPVFNERYDMFVGLRNNLTQKMIKLFALNSGERAITREMWEMIPDKFKYRYRIEVGMNYFVQTYGRGFGSKKFDYYQTFKEKKYGLLKGELLRWWMYLDVLVAYFLTFEDYLTKLSKKDLFSSFKIFDLWGHKR
ncbi:hypothetical protein C0584_03600 [Candidatus Parcubacteria bacterium]|mgnify:CR=1 FL=1|nr:MAG: hypothetical protein C0584_03600 [Candidatus Parcubacteria bacterium]